jgi:hypothetical protein
MKLVELSGKREGISEKTNELETRSKRKNIRDIYRGIN